MHSAVPVVQHTSSAPQARLPGIRNVIYSENEGIWELIAWNSLCDTDITAN